MEISAQEERQVVIIARYANQDKRQVVDHHVTGAESIEELLRTISSYPSQDTPDLKLKSCLCDLFREEEFALTGECGRS